MGVNEHDSICLVMRGFLCIGGFQYEDHKYMIYISEIFFIAIDRYSKMRKDSWCSLSENSRIVVYEKHMKWHFSLHW